MTDRRPVVRERRRAVRPAIRALAAALVLITVLLLTACGEHEPDAGEFEAILDAAPEGDAVELAGITYRVTIARQINPNIPPGEDYYQGPGVPPGHILFAVFVRACNEDGQLHRAAERFRIVNPLGARLEPMDLPRWNVFAYRPEMLLPGECIPGEGGARSADGAMLLFDVPLEVYDNRQFVLEITAPHGRDSARVELDV